MLTRLGWWVITSVSLLVLMGVLTTGFARLSGSGARTVTVQQVGKGYTVNCVEERGVYDYFAGVANSVDEVKAHVVKCLTMKLRADWRE